MLETARSQPQSFADVVGHGHGEPTNPLSLRALFDVGRRRWPDLLLCLAVTLALGGTYVKLTPKKYAATATLLIDTRLAQLSQTDATASSVVDQAAVESQIELLRSEKMLMAVVDKLDLVHDAEFGTAPGATPPPTSPEVARQRTLGVLEANLWVVRIGRSYLVSVSANSTDAAKAMRIANAVADAYISDQVGAKVQTARDQNAWLDAQVVEMRSRAAKAYRAVQDFTTAHDINPMRDLGVQQDIARLSADVARDRAAFVTRRAAMERAQELLAGPLERDGRVPDGKVLRSFADDALNGFLDRFSKVDGDIARLGGTARDQPATLQMVMERTGLVRSVWQRIRDIEAAKRAEWTSETVKEQGLESDLADVKLRDTRTRLVQERLRDLETEAATSRSLYESYLNQLTHAAQQQPVPASDTRVISAATVPLFPSTPKTRLVMVLALLAGLAFALATAFLLESTDDVIRSRDRLEAVTALPCIGITPFIRRGRRDRVTGAGASARLREDLPLLGEAGPRSRAGDVLRSLQVAAYGERRMAGACVMGITSAVAGEGKSTMAVNLAMAAARAGRRALLVDCNLRNPTLTTIVMPNEATGSAEPVGDRVRVEDGLDFVPVNPHSAIDGAEVPDAVLIERLLIDARDRYDIVIVDLPAILPLSELRSVTDLMDQIALVTCWGSTTASQVDRALDRLTHGDRLVGVILNKVDLRKMLRFEGSAARTFGEKGIRFV